MGSEAFNRDLEMANAGCFSPEVPLTFSPHGGQPKQSMSQVLWQGRG